MAERVMRVTGKGSIKAKPDMTRVTITLKDGRKDYDLTLKALADSTDIVKGLLTNLGFAREDVKTTDYHVDIDNESYHDKNGNWKTKFIGYKYSHTMKVEFESDNGKLGKILTLLANNGSVKPEFNFGFFVKDTEAAKNRLLGKAVADAKNKAEVLAQAAGVTLKDIVTVDYSWGEINFEISPLRKMLAEEDDCYESYTPDIEPDDIEASDTVTVIWHIE